MGKHTDLSVADKNEFKTSRFYGKKKFNAYEDVMSAKVAGRLKVKIFISQLIRSNCKSVGFQMKPLSAKRKLSMSSARKKEHNMLNGRERHGACNGKLTNSEVITEAKPAHKRPLEDKSQSIRCKKVKYDKHMTNESDLDSVLEEEETALLTEKEKQTMAASDNAEQIKSINFFCKSSFHSDMKDVLEGENMETNISPSMSSTNIENPHEISILMSSKDRNAKLLAPCKKKVGSLDAFFAISSDKSCKPLNDDSAGREQFRILGESSPVSQCNGSPFASSGGSSGFSTLLTSSVISPESKQSSITKYFTPVRKDSVLAFSRSSISPSSSVKGKLSERKRKTTSPSSSPGSRKRQQLFLDLGQKNFGHTSCPTCHMVYNRSQPDDEAYHLKFHRNFVSGLRFQGWKTERVVEHFDDGRVIVILPQDHPSHLSKVASVQRVVDNELGFCSEEALDKQDCKTYMFIADKRVVGCVIAVAIKEAYPLIPSVSNENVKEPVEQGAWCCSSDPVRAVCGISRIWVLQQHRRKKIATRILDCVRNDFMFGGVVSRKLLAFSDPTPLGKQLAESYCGTDRFLVFR